MSMFFFVFQLPDIITQGCCISVVFMSETVCMSITSCLKCVVSQSNVCLVHSLVFVMSCHRGLVNDMVVLVMMVMMD